MTGLSAALRTAADEAADLENQMVRLNLNMDQQKQATQKLVEKLLAAIAEYNEEVK